MALLLLLSPIFIQSAFMLLCLCCFIATILTVGTGVKVPFKQVLIDQGGTWWHSSIAGIDAFACNCFPAIGRVKSRTPKVSFKVILDCIDGACRSGRSEADLSYAPVASLSYPSVSIVFFLMLNEAVDGVEIAGVLLVTAGVWFIGQIKPMTADASTLP